MKDEGSLCLMLAARMFGLGTTWTSFHLFYEQAAANMLNIPQSDRPGFLLNHYKRLRHLLVFVSWPGDIQAAFCLSYYIL